MIHHISIEADDPMKVATVLAALMGGKAREGFPFEHSCAAFSGDQYGTMIECWQRGKVVAIPQAGPGKFEISESASLQEHQSFHTALSVPLDDHQIMAIAEKAGWETAVGRRSGRWALCSPTRMRGCGATPSTTVGPGASGLRGRRRPRSRPG